MGYIHKLDYCYAPKRERESEKNGVWTLFKVVSRHDSNPVYIVATHHKAMVFGDFVTNTQMHAHLHVVQFTKIVKI